MIDGGETSGSFVLIITQVLNFVPRGKFREKGPKFVCADINLTTSTFPRTFPSVRPTAYVVHRTRGCYWFSLWPFVMFTLVSKTVNEAKSTNPLPFPRWWKSRVSYTSQVIVSIWPFQLESDPYLVV